MSTCNPPVSADRALDLTRQWVDQIVIGLNLCPFAAPDQRAGRVRYAVSEATTEAQAVAEFLRELETIQQSDETSVATTLLVYTQTAQDFHRYLDLLDLCQFALERAGLEGVFQLASFHPEYCFAGVDPEDISHWTNRSPLPMIHIIREGQMSRVLARYKDADQIPVRNIARLEQLGREGLLGQWSELAHYWPAPGNKKTTP